MVRSYLDGKISIAEPRLAATVALVTDSDEGLQTFLLSRQPSMPFAPSQTVFPGGGIDSDDFKLGEYFDRQELDGWSRTIGCDHQKAAAIVGAAIRETFEETGVLFVRRDVELREQPLDATQVSSLRAALNSKLVRFADVLDELALTLDTRPLTAWSRWVTPEWSKRRYDTFIFVARLPTGQEALDDSGEADSAGWFAAQGAVDLYDRGDLAMMTPTLETLRELSGCTPGSVGASPRNLSPIGFSLDVDSEIVRVLARSPAKTTQVHQFLR